MIEAVFISDLHLQPERVDIQERFNQFIAWCKTTRIKRIYILGDFLHAWAGDDAIDEWSRSIAKQLNELSELNIQLYYMHGNRDFLLGKRFAKLAGWTILPEPSIIKLGDEKVLLVHGDRYCTKDKAHQRFRKLTRNFLFPFIFLRLPLIIRQKLVGKVRELSQNNHYKMIEQVDVDTKTVLEHMNGLNIKILIHGHTHRPKVHSYEINNQQVRRYVLSDWDDSPVLLCYHNANGFLLERFDSLRSYNEYTE